MRRYIQWRDRDIATTLNLLRWFSFHQVLLTIQNRLVIKLVVIALCQNFSLLFVCPAVMFMHTEAYCHHPSPVAYLYYKIKF